MRGKNIALLAVAVIALIIFVLIAINIHGKGFLYNSDQTINYDMVKVQNPASTVISKAFHYAFEPAYLIILALIVGLIVWFKDGKNEAYFFSFVIILNACAFFLMKEFIERLRPLNSLVLESGYSFPSGHAVIATAFLGLIIYFTMKHMESKPKKWSIAVISGIIILLTAFSRVYLRVHWMSDVLASLALGIFLLFVSILFFEYLEKG